MQIVLFGNSGDLRQVKGGKAYRRAHQNGFRGFAGALLEYLVLLQRNVVGIAFLQAVKEHIQRALIVLVILTRRSVFDHIHHRFKVLFFLRRFVEQIEDQRTVQCDFRLLPKGIVGHRGLRRGVADDVGNELQHIGIASQIGKGVIAVGLRCVYQIKYFHLVSFFDEQGCCGAEQFAFRIGDDVGRMCLHQVRAGEAAAFTRAAAADAENVDVLLVLVPIQAEAHLVR